jgi:hypothetical protein
MKRLLTYLALFLFIFVCFSATPAMIIVAQNSTGIPMSHESIPDSSLVDIFNNNRELSLSQ